MKSFLIHQEPGSSTCFLAVIKVSIVKILKLKYNSNMMNYDLSMKKGFTLAEVLITLAIIGIVAAMSIPALIAKYQEKVTITRVVEAYSLLSNAYSGLLAEHGNPTMWNIERNTSDWADYFGEKIHFIKKCGIYGTADFKSGCFTDEYYSILKKNKFVNSTPYLYQVQLKNGMSMAFPTLKNTCEGYKWDWIVTNPLYESCGDIVVDINGVAPPNAFGHDLFYFHISRTRIIPRGVPEEPYYWMTRACNNFNNSDIFDGRPNGGSCTAWIIKNKNMDYLKCYEARWGVKNKCD